MLAQKVIVRGFAAAAAQAQSASITSSIESKVSRLPNGLTAASIDLNGPVSSIVLAYRAGSRYQQPDEGGVVHVLRNNFGKDSEKYLGVKLLWQMGGAGGNLSSYATKDLLAVQLDVVRDNSPVGVSLLGEFGSPALKAWDVEDAEHALAVDLKNQKPYDVLLDLFHKSAYRNGGLGIPLLAQPFQQHVDHHKLAAFARSRLVASEAVLLGVNVDHSDLLNYASQQSAVREGKAGSPAESPYIGGLDTRQEGPTSVAHVLIGGEGTGLKDQKAVAVQEVLAALIGASVGLKFANSAVGGAGAVVSATVERAANKRPVGVAPVNVVHADSGLVGVYVATDGQYADTTVRAAYQALKTLAKDGAEADAFKAAQKYAQLEALLHLEWPAHLALDQAHAVLSTGHLLAPSDLAAEIAKVSADDVKQAAKRIVDKPSMAAYGRIGQVPYLDQL
ncbi:Cytochrome b-c1 complex subunit 2, mitochondrial [Aphelenchoides fujianensis]|nr:Cytochrome b-c1 complex subunit 2, mitochondrial [Aphelenchoides fujianensis]